MSGKTRLAKTHFSGLICQGLVSGECIDYIYL